MNGVAISEKSSPPLSPPTRRRQPLLPTTNATAPRHSRHPSSQDSLSPMTYATWRVRRLLTRPLVWVLIILVTLLVFWSNGGIGRDLQASELQARLKELLPPEVMRNLQFIPASHHKIHVRAHRPSLGIPQCPPRGRHTDSSAQFVGRWTTAPNRLRIDGAFPGSHSPIPTSPSFPRSTA